MHFVKFEVHGLGTVAIREQAVAAAKAKAEKDGVPVIVTGYIDDGRTRKVTFNPDGTHTHYVDSWTDYLSEGVERRLGNCHSSRSDIEELVNTRWFWMKEHGKDKEGFTKEDALVYILDLLDCNSQYIDLTKAEYDALCRE